MIYVLDTNAVSALMKGSPAVIERLAATTPVEVAIPAGARRDRLWNRAAPRSKRRTSLQARFDLLSAELPRAEWTDAISQIFGRINATLERRGTRIEDFDAAIAFDEWEIQAGDSIPGKSNDGLAAFEAFVILWWANANKSNWMRQELHTAITRAMGTHTVKIIPCVLDDTARPPLIGRP